MAFGSRKKAEREVEKLQKKWKREEKVAKFKRQFKQPMQYKEIAVPDWDDRTEQLWSICTHMQRLWHQLVPDGRKDLPLLWQRTGSDAV